MKFICVLFVLNLIKLCVSDEEVGCFKIQSVNISTRFSVRDNTECTTSCGRDYYRYAGINYGKLCYCHNVLELYMSDEFCQTCWNNPSSCDDQTIKVYSTGVLTPGPVKYIRIENITDSSSHVVWNKPISGVDILQYQVTADVLHTYSNKSIHSLTWTFSSNTFRTALPGLHPGTKYNITVRAASRDRMGPPTSAVFETLISVPDQQPPDPEIVSREGKEMVVKLFPVQNNNGPVSQYRLIVLNLDQLQVFQSELLRSYDQAVYDGLSYYIAAQINPKDINKEFVIGDGKRYDGYYNAPLEEDTRYYISMGVVSELNGITEVLYPNVRESLRVDSGVDGSGSSLVFVLSVAVGVASVLLLLGVIVLLFLRRRFHRNRRQRLSDNHELSIQGPMIQVANHGYVPDEDIGRVNHYEALKEMVWNIPRDNLRVNPGDVLGFGQFGHVLKGEVQRESTFSSVACYVISDGDLMHEDKRSMLRQLDVLIKAGKHKNLASLIGTCENPDAVFVVLEYNSTNLKDMLLENRHFNHTKNTFTSLSEVQILDMLIATANGMDYLSQKSIIHERLCARNVWIFDGNLPKIAGHGISHFKKNNMALDYSRWTAQEVLKGKPYTVKSDVWSFGCLLWEVCTLGATPYNHVEGPQVSYEVCRGMRLLRPSYLGEEFYQLLLNCWQCDQDERPTFKDILEQLYYFKDSLTIYAHLSFDLSANFSYEPFIPALEVKEESIAHP